MSKTQSGGKAEGPLTFEDLKSRFLGELEALLNFLNESDDVRGGLVSYQPNVAPKGDSKAKLWLAAPELAENTDSNLSRYDLTEDDEEAERAIFVEALESYTGLDFSWFEYHGIDRGEPTEVTIKFSTSEE